MPRAAKPPKSSADAQRIVRKKAAVTAAAPPLSDAERRKQARQAQLKEQRRLQRGLDGDAGGGDAGAVEAALPAARRNASKGVVQPAVGATGKAGKASAMVEAAQARLSGACGGPLCGWMWAHVLTLPTAPQAPTSGGSTNSFTPALAATRWL